MKVSGLAMKTCTQCGRDIVNRHAKAIYCSDKCRTAASRKRTGPLAARKVQRLEAEVQRLRTWVKWPQNENRRPRRPGRQARRKLKPET